MILVASYSSALGGAERLLIEFVSGLEGERCLACPPGALADAARAAGLRVLVLRSRRLALRQSPVSALLAGRDLAGHARELRRLTGDLAPDALVAWGMRPLLACTLGRIEVPVVFQHNDLLPGPLLGRVIRTAAARAALVVALSQAIADDLRIRGHVAVVAPGLDVSAFDATVGPASPPQVLVLGALVAWKRPDVALEAFAQARRALQDARLRFVGAPLQSNDRVLERARARARAPDLAGAVEFAGPVADAREELARATCLLHCAEREPFGLAVLEALASGRPAVVPAAGGPLEIVDDSCGVLYPPGDAAAAADALVRVVGDRELAEQMGARGRARVRARFDRDRARTRWAQLVTSAARRRPAPADAHGLAVVTVTHNSAAVLPALLHSLARHLPGAQAIVVDTGSADGSLEVARDRAVAVLALEENVGFGRGCNRGVSAVERPVTALVNPDVELLDDSLLLLADEALRRNGPERLLAPRVLYPDGSRQDSVHPRPASAPDLIRSVLPWELLGGAAAPWRAATPRRVGWAVGCALVARTETLRRLGPFDERIFLYGEDLDLALRAAQSGIETWFWPAARVLHHRAHSTATVFGGEPYELLARARHDVVARRLGRGRARLDDIAQTLTFGSRLLAKRVIRQPAARERRQLAALRGLGAG